MELKIECQGATTVNLDELKELHHFKTTSDAQYAHLRNSLTEFGFSFPFFIWIDSQGTKWLMDGHRRKPTLIRMRDEGYQIPPLPAVLVFAPDKKTAKKKLLAQESTYGTFDEDGFTDFMNEDGSSLINEDLSLYVEIPGLDLGDVNQNNNQAGEPDPPQLVQCPQCSTQFNPKGNEV